MSEKFKDHFSTKSDAYASYRPKYPRALVEELAKLCATKSTALDCGCGSGQLSVLLADYFDQVIATDASSKQIENAESHAKITYKVATAENIPLPDSSVDIITVAQAAHWLDLEKFYAEVKRLLKPGGVIALITYQNGILENIACNNLVQYFYGVTLDQYWPSERKHVESGYQTLNFPFNEIKLPSLHMTAEWNFHEFFGYISTWSAFKAYENAGGIGKISEFKANLTAAWRDVKKPQKITWPLYVRAAYISQ
jgi:ubiquinone/menaquinone biosynthesis C-methylase UbiE